MCAYLCTCTIVCTDTLLLSSRPDCLSSNSWLRDPELQPSGLLLAPYIWHLLLSPLELEHELPLIILTCLTVHEICNPGLKQPCSSSNLERTQLLTPLTLSETQPSQPNQSNISSPSSPTTTVLTKFMEGCAFDQAGQSHRSSGHKTCPLEPVAQFSRHVILHVHCVFK